MFFNETALRHTGRRAEREKSRRGGKSSGFGASAIPDLRDTASRQKFFIQEVQLGEALLSQGELEEGVLHIANAAAVCAEGEQFIQVLASSLPREILQMVISALPDARRRIQASQSSSSGGGDKRTATIREVDEEVDVE